MSLTVISPHKLEAIVDQQHFLDPIAMQQFADFFGIGAFARGHQLVFARHHLGDLHVHPRLEANVATRDDADELASGHDRDAGDVVLAASA